MVDVGGNYYILPTAANSSAYTINGSVTVGTGSQLVADNSLTLFASGSGSVQAGVTIRAQQAALKSTQINLGTDNYALPGLVLDQAALDGLAGVNSLTLQSSGAIDLYGSLSLGEVGSNGQPILDSLTLDSADVVETGTSGTATFTAEQVTLQNSLSGSFAQTVAPVSGAALAINATDVLGVNASGQATGHNNAQISFGDGTVTLAGFGEVDLRSTGQIVTTGALLSGTQVLSPTMRGRSMWSLCSHWTRRAFPVVS